MSNRLFEVEQRERDCPPNRSFVAGRIVELRATAELVERGHAVAVPVVDDGVDLVVDYRVKVQIKSSTHVHAGSGSAYRGKRYAPVPYLTFNVSRKKGDGTRFRYDVDVFLLFDAREDQRVFYVVPASEMGATGLLALSRKYQGYREAWHVFGDVLAELAA